jgi:hypothetical protein
MLQLPHNTAVLVERATKVGWVVDMWPRGYLQPPDVMTVEKWATEDCAAEPAHSAPSRMRARAVYAPAKCAEFFKRFSWKAPLPD